jgi:hypothetical protein
MPEDSVQHINFDDLDNMAVSKPLVPHMYTADPSAHVFGGKIYIYPSHDIDGGEAFDDLGSHFAMEDYHVISMDSPSGSAKDNGVALHVKDVPWASKQMWAPDANEKNGTYYLFFPAKDKEGIFRIGVALSDSPIGPFRSQPIPIENSFSIDPAVFKDDDERYYMYFGGLWGGQLQRWRTGVFNAEQPDSPTAHLPKADEPALCPKIAKLSEDLLAFAEDPKDVAILDEAGKPLLSGDTQRRFFEAAWMHKYKGRYYFSYSTGDSHFICYGIGDNPYGPFTYAGKILEPVVGWTTHHSIVQFNNDWYLFYHDSSLSRGVTHLRSIKVIKIEHDESGYIKTIQPYRNTRTG